MSEIKPVYTCNMQSVSGSSSSQQPVLIDESVFSQIDKDGNGSISVEEAKDYGFCAWEIKEDLKKSDFDSKLKTFNEQMLAKSKENRTTEDSDNDFQHHFQKHSQDGNVVHDVTLSYEEQQTLLKRMNDFEQYKAGLSEENKKELEKNKSSLTDFELQNNDAGKHFKNYAEFRDFYLELKNKLTTATKAGKNTTLSNDELAQILHYTDTTDLVSDGKLGSSAQGFGYDCWALSQLNNYAQTKEGAKNIKTRIKQNDDGTFTVTFQNPKSQQETKTYTITKKELQKYGVEEKANGKKDYKYYSSGDIDTRVFEIAVNQMLIDNGINYENGLPSIGGGEPIKKVLLHRAMGYNGDIITYNKIEDGTILSIKYGLNQGKLTLTSKKEENFQSLSDVLQMYKDSAGSLVCTTSKNLQGKKTSGKDISKQNWYIAGGHVYNISEIKDGSVIIQNPYLTTFPLSITQDRFINTNEGYNFNGVTYLPSGIKYPCK